MTTAALRLRGGEAVVIRRWSQYLALSMSLTMLGCTRVKDAPQKTVRATQPVVALSQPETSSHPEGQCLANAEKSGFRAISFARADSAAHVVLRGAGIDPRGECVVEIAHTDSSVILSYATRPGPSAPPAATPGIRVLHFGGAVVIEVLASGRAKWLYATQ